MDIDIGKCRAVGKDGAMASATIETRVRFAETDAMGVTHHANYLTWFEMARVQLLDQLGCPYRHLEEAGFLLPVLEAGMTYHRPTRFDDRVTVTVHLELPAKARLRLTYEVRCEGELAAEGFTEHAFVDRSFRPVRPPESFATALARHGHGK
jgi:acyl-CoA thioester hydrolase